MIAQPDARPRDIVTSRDPSNSERLVTDREDHARRGRRRVLRDPWTLTTSPSAGACPRGEFGRVAYRIPEPGWVLMYDVGHGHGPRGQRDAPHRIQRAEPRTTATSSG